MHKSSVSSDVNDKIYTICHSSEWESYDRSDIGRFFTFESNFILTTFPYIRTSFYIREWIVFDLVTEPEPLADIPKDVSGYDTH